MNFSILYFISNELDKKLRFFFLGLTFFYSIFTIIALAGLRYMSGVIETALIIFIHSLNLLRLSDLIKKIKFFFTEN